MGLDFVHVGGSSDEVLDFRASSELSFASAGDVYQAWFMRSHFGLRNSPQTTVLLLRELYANCVPSDAFHRGRCTCCTSPVDGFESLSV